VTPVASPDLWQPGSLFVAALGSVFPTTMSERSPIRLSELLAARPPRPPLQILYCTWLA
jgi:hypothetical protein